MTNQTKLIILAVLAALIVIIVLLLLRNSKREALNKEIDEINVRYNAIKSIPIAFKLNKAQAAAKRSSETSEAIKEYYLRYEEAQKKIDKITVTIEDIEDDLEAKNYKSLKEALPFVDELISEAEEEINKIDAFLEQFSMKENEQREVSQRLKEKYLNLKMAINENAPSLTVSYDGLVKKLEKVEELFSQSEEWLYANDYVKSQEVLEDISENIKDIKASYLALPELVKNAKGVVPVLFEETERQYALTRQRGVYVDHLNVEKTLSEVQKSLNASLKKLSAANIDNVKQELDVDIHTLQTLLDSIEKENADFLKSRELCDSVFNNIEQIAVLQNYVSVSYSKDSKRFNMDDIGEYIKEVADRIDAFKSERIELAGDIESNTIAPSVIKNKLEDLNNRTLKDVEILSGYKKQIDKNSNDELRAKTQLIKLQVVLNEVEVKVQQYHLPAIASSYKADLAEGRNKIARIKALLSEIPLDIDTLNKTLQDAIDSIYNFYNNVNNIVGMAIMVENAIVFGNKYRSTYIEVDRDLSKAEFSYLNGEYTKALTMSISCMETLFPNKSNEKILENS